MDLVRAGGDRQAMHELIREHSLTAWEAVQRGEPNPLGSLLSSDASITRWLPGAEVLRILDSQSHVGDAAERSTKLSHDLGARLDELERR
jgi:adenylosuccinate lyase